jgi:hypothetical protein
MRACWERWRRCSLISAGPVAQLMPMTSGRIGSRAASAAPISVPGSMRAGQLDGDLHLDRHLRPTAAMARGQPIMAAFSAEQVELGLDEEQVDAALEQAPGLHLVGVAQLGEADLAERGNLVPGPIEPATVSQGLSLHRSR